VDLSGPLSSTASGLRPLLGALATLPERKFRGPVAKSRVSRSLGGTPDRGVGVGLASDGQARGETLWLGFHHPGLSMPPPLAANCRPARYLRASSARRLGNEGCRPVTPHSLALGPPWEPNLQPSLARLSAPPGFCSRGPTILVTRLDIRSRYSSEICHPLGFLGPIPRGPPRRHRDIDSLEARTASPIRGGFR